VKLEIEISNKLLAKIMNCAKSQGKLLEEFITESLEFACDELKRELNHKHKEVDHG
jgi:hypothetical protein